MKKFLAGLVIAALFLPDAALATYSGFGTNEPYDSTGGSQITSEVIQDGQAKKVKKKTKKKVKKKKGTKAKAQKHKKSKAKKTKKSAKKTATQDKSPITEHTIDTQGETLPPLDLPGAAQ